RPGTRPGGGRQAVEHATSRFATAVAEVHFGEDRTDDGCPDVAGAKLVCKPSLELRDALLLLPQTRERPTAHRAGDAEELRLDDLVFEHQGSLGCEESGPFLALCLKM